MRVRLCIKCAYLKEPGRNRPHRHALSWGEVPEDGAGSCCCTLKQADKIQTLTRIYSSLKIQNTDAHLQGRADQFRDFVQYFLI